MDSTAAKIVRSQDGGPGRAGGQKIENHHMGECRHADMFFGQKFTRKSDLHDYGIDSARLGN